MVRDSKFEIRSSGGGPIPEFESRISWLIQTQAQIPQNDGWLSEAEKIVSRGFPVPKRRNDWLLGRWTAKQAIMACRDKTYPVISSLEIRAAQDGAPEPYYEGAPAPVSISISHSKDQAMCAVALDGGLIGCDLEWIESREPNFAEDYFTQEEISFLLHAPAGRDAAETLIWSAKETVLKILRRGLTRDTRSVLIRPGLTKPGDSWHKWTGQCLESSRLFHGWWRAAEGFIYSIAVDADS